MSVVTKIVLYIVAAGLVSLLFLLLYRRADRGVIMKFLGRLLIYITPLTIVLGIFLVDYRKMGPILNGISMNEQLDSSFSYVLSKPYHTMVMGNSRTYRGVNPDKIDSSVYNFSFDNETFLEQYFKLKYLEYKHHLPEFLILGVDYFEFSFLSMAMQPTYSKYFGATYDSLMSSLSKAGGIEYQTAETPSDWVNAKMSAIFGRGASQYIRYLGDRIAGKPLQAPYLKGNGQYIINPIPMAHDGEFMTRPSNIEPYQQLKFEQIMDFLRNKGIRVILLMPPCRKIELNCYSNGFKQRLDDYFRKFERKDSVWYLNMSELAGYSTDDYMDDTHLKPQAADLFSTSLNDTIKGLK